jgi:hypothetical protein
MYVVMADESPNIDKKKSELLTPRMMLCKK